MKNILIFITLFFLTSCALNQPTYDQQVIKARDNCNKRLESKEFLNLSEMLENCRKPETLRIYGLYYGDRNVDLMTAVENKNIELAKKLENGKITQIELDKSLEDFSKKQFDIAKKREEVRQKAEKEKWEKEEAERVKEYKRQEAARQKEEARLAKYYREHPEVLIQQQQLQLQQQQLQAMQQQNAIAEQQMRNNAYVQQQQLNLQQQQQFSQPSQNQKMECQSHVMGNYINTKCDQGSGVFNLGLSGKDLLGGTYYRQGYNNAKMMGQ